jgi:membrane protein implicated in regulation of membrane protease activity
MKEKEGKEMGEEKNDKPYPVKSLHDFLFELDREWSKFRNGTLIGLISSGFLFVVVLWLILIIRHLPNVGLIGFIFLVLAGVFLGYSVYAMYAQYRFFNKWERRIGLLLHLEEQILAGKLEEKQP